MKTHEQFDKLAEQCYVKTGSVQTDHFDYVKFAELIVRKSIEVVKDSQGYNQYFPHVTENIKQHFGVE